MTQDYWSRAPGFYQLTLSERKTWVEVNCLQSPILDDALLGGITVQTADQMVENTIGVFNLPLGLAVNFVVDGQPCVVPMVTEEPSVVAACSHIAKLAALAGGFVTHVDPPVMIAQIHLLDIHDSDATVALFEANRAQIIQMANDNCINMVERGGGCVGVELRLLPGEPLMMALHLLVDCRDAMGANIVNSMAESIAPRLGQMLGVRIGMSILSNLSDRRLARSEVTLPFQLLAADKHHDDGERVAVKICEGYEFATRDPYRACTHNKGIMNGIDALAIATGNDFRAIEAGAHAYAARDGQYRSLTRYRIDQDSPSLVASIELPLALGVKGGITMVHSGVQQALKILGSFGGSSTKLAGLMASVGLAQNLGALLALVTFGIQKGHMALHARKSGASP